MEWNALHLFVHDRNYHNLFLVDYLTPAIHRLEEQKILLHFFYICYWQGGNHIRFRFQATQPQTVKAEVCKAFNEFLTVYDPHEVMPEDIYYRVYRNNKENVEDITWVEDRSVKEITYEPEFERYGGMESITYQERIFELSSRFALEGRRKAGNQTVKNVINGLDWFSVFLGNVNNRKEFLEYYIKYWREFSGGEKKLLPVDRLAAIYKERYDAILHGQAAEYEDLVQNIRQYQDESLKCQTAYPNREIAATLLAASQIHMNHNRLGIIPLMEHEIAEILLKCECK